MNILSEDPDVFFSSKDSKTPTGLSGNYRIFHVHETDQSPLVEDTETKRRIGTIINIEDSKGQEEAMATLGSVEWLVVECHSDSWQMIPAENLIAAAQASGTKLAFCVDDVSNVGGLARALELGVDALCVNAAVATKELWDSVFEARQERQVYDKQVKEVTVESKPCVENGICWRRSTQSTMLADRVCVDFAQNLLPEEGCWVGSSAKINALVLSEAAVSQYVPSRKFRVNAGPVHSYIVMHDETTKYLSELEAGDLVEVYNSKTGISRGVAVGRLKQELRPCVLLELESENESQRGQIFLQQAETVRLAQPNGEFIRVTELQSQAEKSLESISTILLRLTTTGTHVGKAYSGSVNEK